MGATRSFDEEARVNAVREERILDTAPEPDFDDLVQIAARAFRVAIAAINFIDRDRQWFKAAVGTKRATLPRHVGFCPLVVATGETLVVSDAAASADWTTWAAGLGSHTRFYAGAPLLSRGQVLGTICLADPEPRTLGDEERTLLQLLARRVIAALVARRQRHRLQQTLSDRQAALEATAIAQSMLAQAPDAIALLDREKRFVGQNEAHRRLFGFADRELRTLTPAVLSGDAVDATIAEALSRTGWFHGEVPCRNAEGQTLAVDLTLVPLRNTSGELVGHGSFIRDVKPKDEHLIDAEVRRRAEAAIAQLQQNLEALRAELTKRRRASDQERRGSAAHVQGQRLQAISQATSGITHELNNLLTVIIGHASVLQLGLPGDDPRRADVKPIVEAAERASALTHRLLAFNHHQAVSPRPVDVNALLGGLIATLRGQLSTTIDVALHLEPGIGSVLCDPRLLEEIVQNLVANAQDAMPEGGVLTIESASASVDTQAPPAWAHLRQGPYIRLRVSDTGAGMRPEVLSRVFEPFFTTKEVGRGSGLGLSTVYGVVTQSGGHVDVTSEPGRGTTVSILLPKVELATSALPPEPLPPTTTRGGGETLLLVDDDDAVRTLAASILRRAGYTVLEASSGADAVDAASNHRETIDLLVADVVMPGMTSAGLARRLLSSRPGMKLLYMSGYTHDTENLSLGSDSDFLPKPFTPADLLDRVRRLLDRP